MKIKLLTLALLGGAVAACGQAEAEVNLHNDLPIEAMVVSDEERHQEVEAQVQEVADRRDMSSPEESLR